MQEGKDQICFLPDRVSLARVSGNLLAADGEARGASFRTGVLEFWREDSGSDAEAGKQIQIDRFASIERGCLDKTIQRVKWPDADLATRTGLLDGP